MTRKFLVPLVLPADPTNPLEAATKAYVDAKAGANVVFQTGAPTDTNLLWADTDEAAGGEFIAGVRTPFNERTRQSTGSPTAFGGIPGRRLYYDASYASVNFNLGWAWALPFPVISGDLVTVSSYRTIVSAAQASALMDIAVYSTPSWSTSATMTKVTGTNVSAIALSTTGSKNGVLSTPVTLPTGRYYLVYVVYGSASTPTCEGMRLADQGFLGTAADQGNNATYEYFTVATGLSSLPSTLPASSMAQAGAAYPVTIIPPLSS